MEWDWVVERERESNFIVREILEHEVRESGGSFGGWTTAAGDGGRIFIRSAFVQNRGLGSDWEAKDDNTLLAAGACALPGDGKVCWSRACIMASGGSFTRQREPFFVLWCSPSCG